MRKTSSLFLLLATLSSTQCASVDVIRNEVLPVTRIFYNEKDGKRMLQMVKENGRKLLDCHVYGDERIANEARRLSPTVFTKEVDKKRMNKLINVCSTFSLNHLISDISRADEYSRNLFIFPGTKWCGAGDVADGYDDLGTEREADACCRAHDHCNDSTAAFGTKHNLTNYSFYTASNCQCDDEFHSCLQKAGTLVANILGLTYFNILQTRCFKYEYRQIGCLDEEGNRS